MKPVEFLEIVKLLEDNYGKVLPDNIKKIWYEEFKDFKKENLKTMAIESLKEFSYFPTVNQVKKMYSKIPLDRREDFKICENTKYKYDLEGGWLIYERL